MIGRQMPRLRQAFAFVASVCEDLGVEPREIHVGQTFGYYEVTVQVGTAFDVVAVADALGIPGKTETRGERGTIVLRQQEPWTPGAVVLPLERPGTLYPADRVTVIAFGVGR